MPVLSRAPAVAAFVLVAIVAACASTGAAPLQRLGGVTMGSTWEVQWTGAASVDTVRVAIDAELGTFDACFSQWRDDSEITRWNRRRSDAPFAASRLFCEVLQRALDVAALTDGAFDPTVKPLSDLYRAAKADPQHAFDDAAAHAVLPRVNHRLVHVRDGAVTADRGDVQLDLNGIAAGACVDAIVRRLDELRVPAFCVDVTGEVFCRGERAPGESWQVAVGERARGLTPRSVSLCDAALCTSGVYENAIVAGGRPRHHVFDPRTGECADNGVVTATVLAKTAMLADPLATAFVVLGAEGAARVLTRMRANDGVAASLLVIGDDGTLRVEDFGWPR